MGKKITSLCLRGVLVGQFDLDPALQESKHVVVFRQELAHLVDLEVEWIIAACSQHFKLEPLEPLEALASLYPTPKLLMHQLFLSFQLAILIEISAQLLVQPDLIVELKACPITPLDSDLVEGAVLAEESALAEEAALAEEVALAEEAAHAEKAALAEESALARQLALFLGFEQVDHQTWPPDRRCVLYYCRQFSC